MKEFNIDGVRVEQTSEIGLTLDSRSSNGNSFLDRDTLKNVASKLLDKEEYKNFIIFYDGCMTYNIQKL